MDDPSELKGLTDGLTARPMTLADVDIVTELVAACELHHDGVVEIDREDIEVDWARPAYDLATESIGVFDGDRLVAEAELFKGKRAEINVHPDALGRGIGIALLGWTEDLAARQGSTRVSQTTTNANTAAADILEAHGYGYGHTSWILEIEHDARPDDPSLPAGIGFRDYEPERDAHEAYRVIEDAFNEWPNRDPATFEDWAALTIERPSFAPWQMILATDEHTGDIVGVSFMLDYEAEGGWVQQVATRASHRHRGIARAMLLRAFQVFWDQGERVVGLNTDSRTGALGMYEKVGMHVKRSYTNRAKDLGVTRSS
jgi:GNAT superfamily N-acetyltransferase